jgi:D-alanyl-D-alanine carboxypeptidase (penicillin-binding protein 5/6)
VDADTGRIIDGSNVHTPLPPASMSKVITALTVRRVLPINARVPVSARAAGVTPNKVGMLSGQVWTFANAIRALMLSSANDAAIALAERSAGSVTAFQRSLQQTGTNLHMVDRPVLRDPAGLDDSSSVGGGNLISPRDMAIAGRALLTDPYLAPIVGTRTYDFRGPDGHRFHLVNHNKLLVRYNGLVGIKTGYTMKAGGTLMTAARRNGRTMLTVVMGTNDIYGTTTALLNKGFATPVRAEPTADRIPVVGRILAVPHPLPGATNKIKRIATTSTLAKDVVLGSAAVGAVLFFRVRRKLRKRRKRRRR